MFIIFCYNANMHFGVYETKKIFFVALDKNTT